MRAPKIRLTFDLDRDQIKILMGQIDTLFDNFLGMPGSTRTLDTLAEAVRMAGRLECDDDDMSYMILKLAPIYRELLRYGADPTEEINAWWTPDDDAELAEADQAAIAALAT